MVPLKRNNVQSLYDDWKATRRWQKLKLFSTDLTNLDLNCNDFSLIKGSTHTNSFLGARAYTFLSMKTILNLHNGYTRVVSEHKYNSILIETIKSFDRNVKKVTSITIFLKNILKINCFLMKKLKIRI